MTDPYPTTSEMMALAKARTGLSDFGDSGFVEGLEVLRGSLIRDVAYAPADAAGALDLMIRRLENRLRIEDWFRRHPEAESAPIVEPVSICGLPRTGTTALGNMMSLDPQFRSLRAWEQVEPCPPPRTETEMEDPRRIRYRAYIEKVLKDDPDQAAMHLWDLDSTMEDTEVLGLEFRAQQMTMPVFGYHDWWRRGDMRDAFRYHARVARLLQSRRPPNRWLFKAPHHKFHLESIVEAYPDIRFVFTHRDPARSVPSYASFVASLFPADVVARIGRETIGREIHNHLLTGMKQAVAARDALGPDRFIDVHHGDFVADPMGQIERIYAFLGLELTPDVRASLHAWHAENESGAHGAHRYTAEQYGLDPDAIRRDYAFYIERFGVACGPTVKGA